MTTERKLSFGEIQIFFIFYRKNKTQCCSKEKQRCLVVIFHLTICMFISENIWHSAEYLKNLEPRSYSLVRKCVINFWYWLNQALWFKNLLKRKLLFLEKSFGRKNFQSLFRFFFLFLECRWRAHFVSAELLVSSILHTWGGTAVRKPASSLLESLYRPFSYMYLHTFLKFLNLQIQQKKVCPIR